MKTTLLILPALLAAQVVTGCSSATFGAGTSRRAESAIVPGSGTTNPQAPLDVSASPGTSSANAPLPGSGAQQTRSINLDCDQSAGAVVVVSANPTATPLPGSETFDPLPSLRLGDPNAGNGVILVDKGGNPVDKYGNPVTIGKGDGTDTSGGKGSEVFPIATPVPVPTASKVVMTVNGKFCPKNTNSGSTTVLFVVDYSGSMGAHVEQSGGNVVPGNDPQVNGTCGRLAAAQTLIQQLQAAGGSPAVGFVPFAGGVVTSRVIAPTDLADFAQNYVNANVFCSYVVQDDSFGLDPQNPGGIDGSQLGIDASTNYVAAFTAASSFLSGVYGDKQIYFISDGEPTSPGGDGSTATPQIVSLSVAAGQALRNSVDNLTFNALLLQNAEIGTQAQGILAAVAGSANQVVMAANAGALATQIAQFQSVLVTLSNGQAVLNVPTYPATTLGLAQLQPDSANPGQWDYITQPFVLEGIPGQTVLNTVQVTAQGSDGTVFSAAVQIQYQE